MNTPLTAAARWRGLMSLGLLLVLTACSGLGQTPPPTPLDIDSMATAVVLTAEAPPPGHATVSIPAVDAGLADQTGYHYTLELRFEGVRDADLTPTTGYIQAEVWWDGIAPARRVVLDADGDAFAGEPRALEAVRIIDDYYLLDAEGRCLMNVDETARGVANLDAGSLIGGATDAPYGRTNAVLNGVQAYRYAITADEIVLPPIDAESADGALTATGELWVTLGAEADAMTVVRYYANVELDHVRLFEAEATVSGQLFIRYDVSDLGVTPNISIPYGC